MNYANLHSENHLFEVEITKLSNVDYRHFYDRIHLLIIMHLFPCFWVILHHIGRGEFHLQVSCFSLVYKLYW